MSRDRIHSKLLQRLGEKVEEQNLPPRSDMYVADTQSIDSMKCNLLIGYDAYVAGAPTLSQVERFVESKWHGKIHAQSTTARLHEGEEAISILVTAHTDTRPVTDATVMTRITTNAYMDEQTGAMWHIADDGTQKYLMRRAELSIDEIVGSPNRVSRKQARFGELRTAAAMLTTGDTVRFWDGAMPMIGKVTSLSSDGVGISANGKGYSVAREAVFNIVERSEGQLSAEKSTLQDYYARAFGNEQFAKDLTRKLNQQADGGLGSDTGFSGTTGLGQEG